MPSRSGERTYRHTARWRGPIRKAVLERDGYRCVWCGHPGDDGQGKGLTLAHLVDHDLGGSDDPSNLVTACRPCHGRMDGGKSNGGRGR